MAANRLIDGSLRARGEGVPSSKSASLSPGAYAIVRAINPDTVPSAATVP